MAGALDEQERKHIVDTYHRTASNGLPNVKVHAAFHALVENQLAEWLECVVRAMARLTNEGLSRHDALHVIGSVVGELQFEAAELKTQDDANTIQRRYNAAVERLSAKEWRRRYGA